MHLGDGSLDGPLAVINVGCGEDDDEDDSGSDTRSDMIRIRERSG